MTQNIVRKTTIKPKTKNKNRLKQGKMGSRLDLVVGRGWLWEHKKVVVGATKTTKASEQLNFYLGFSNPLKLKNEKLAPPHATCFSIFTQKKDSAWMYGTLFRHPCAAAPSHGVWHRGMPFTTLVQMLFMYSNVCFYNIIYSYAHVFSYFIDKFISM